MDCFLWQEDLFLQINKLTEIKEMFFNLIVKTLIKNNSLS